MATKKKTHLLILTALLFVSLAACGKRPKEVSVPNGSSDQFQNVYPDLSTDPK